MYKNILYLLFVCIFPLFMQSCQYDGEIISNEYVRFQIKLIYPNSTLSDYVITYNGKNINNSYFPKTDDQGRFQVYSKDSTSLLLDTLLSAKENSQIELIQLPGKKMEFYHAEDYLTFSAVLALYEGYKMTIGGQDIVSGTNYLKNVDATKDIVYIDASGTPVSTEKSNIQSGDNFIVLQTSDKDFTMMSGGGNDEKDPVSKSISKVRFFYTPTGDYNVDAIQLMFISYHQDDPGSTIEFDVDSVVVEKGKLSPYIELDLAKYKAAANTPAGFAYSVYKYDLATKKRGDLIEDVMNGYTMFSPPSLNDSEPFDAEYKFITYMVRKENEPLLMEKLSTPW